MFGSIPALLAGIGGLTKAAGHFTGNRDLLKIGSAGQMLGAGLGQISDMTAGSAGEGVGLKVKEGRDTVSELAQTDGSIMSRMIDQGHGDLLGKSGGKSTQWLDDLLKDSKTSVFDDAYSKKSGIDTPWSDAPVTFLGI